MPFSLKNILFFPGWKYALVAIIVLATGGYFFFGNNTSLGATFTILPGDFSEETNVSGTVIAAQNVDLGFATNGRIAGTYAKVGQHISRGTILAQIENGDLAASLEQKKAALAEAQANLASTQAGTRPEEIAVAAATVTNAEAALVDAIQNAYTVSDDAVHNRADSLFTNPRTSPKISFIVTNVTLASAVERERADLEASLTAWALLIAKLTNENAVAGAAQSQTYLAQVATLLADTNNALNQGIADQTTSAATLAAYGTTLATARTNVNAAATTLSTNSATLNAAQKNLTLKQSGSTPESIAAGQASVAAARADVENAAAALAKTLVSAPFAGTVTRMDAKTGEIVSPSASLISMQSDGIFQIETFVPEVVIAHVAVGNPATTTLDAYGSTIAFPAIVIAVDPAETIKDGVPAYKTTLSFLSADVRIRSGMTANVVIQTGVLHDAIVIPAGAVGTKNGVRYVSVLNQNIVSNRTVTVGVSPARGQREILSGLARGDVILLAPQP